MGPWWVQVGGIYDMRAHTRMRRSKSASYRIGEHTHTHEARIRYVGRSTFGYASTYAHGAVQVGVVVAPVAGAAGA